MSELRPIGRLWRELATAEPNELAITCGQQSITRGTLERESNMIAHQLDRLGVGPGNLVTIALPNSVGFFVAALAAWKLGAVPQPVSPRLPLRERQAIVELADSAAIIGSDEHDHPGRATLSLDQALREALDETPILPDRTSPALKAPTSGGSTGRPKLIVSGESSALNPDQGLVYGMARSGCQLVPGPLYHNSPFSFSIAGLLLGQHLIVLPQFDPERALEAIGTHRVSWVNLVPTMMLRMWRCIEQHPNRYDLSSLDFVWHMAAPCPPWLKDRWIDLIGPDRIMEVYGGTEAQVSTFISGRDWLTHRGSVGRPVNGEICIMDETGAEVPVGEVGEVFLRPDPTLPPSYRYIGAEARVVRGWETLGDLGWMDAEGYLYISDRRLDLIVCGGANIYPAEVEAAIDAHPSVASSVVVGLPDHDLGQRAHAVVQAVAPLTETELLEHLKEHLVRYKHPRSIEFVDQPLRDDAGKVRRAWVRERVIARTTSAPGAAVAPEENSNGHLTARTSKQPREDVAP